MSTQEDLSVEVFSELLNTTEPYIIDEYITSRNYIAVQPSSQNNLNVGGPIVLQTMFQDGYFRPQESYITIQGRLLKEDGTAYNNNEDVTLVNNAMMYLFTEAKYSISDTEMETVLNLGQTTSIYGYLTLPDDFSTTSGLMRCWSKDTTTDANSYKFTKHAAKAADVAIAAGDFFPTEEHRYNQGFAARKSHIFSSNPKGYFEFTIPFNHIF